MDQERTDCELMDAAGVGDKEAYRLLVERYYRRVVSFLSGFVGDPDRAQDLSQEAFVKLYTVCRREGSKGRTGEASSLVFTIAANLGRDELRRRGRRKEVEMSALQDHLAARDESPEQAAARAEMIQKVYGALDELPVDTKQLLVMRDVEGMRYEEIAATLSLKLGTIKSRINRARLAFKNAFLKRQAAGYGRGVHA